MMTRKAYAVLDAVLCVANSGVTLLLLSHHNPVAWVTAPIAVMLFFAAVWNWRAR
jgi:hypothetical protein